MPPRWWRSGSRSNAACSLPNDMRGVVITSGVAYGDGGGGVPGVLLGSPRDDDGNLIMLGSGQQHWDTVHVADLAEVFRRVLEDESARGRYAVTDGLNPTVAEITEAAAVAVGAPGAVPGSDEEARGTLGRLFRRSPAARSERPGHQGSERARLASIPSGTRRGVPPWKLPPGDGRLTGPRRRSSPGAGASPQHRSSRRWPSTLT